jgi:hypothetical protein
MHLSNFHSASTAPGPQLHQSALRSVAEGSRAGFPLANLRTHSACHQSRSWRSYRTTWPHSVTSRAHGPPSSTAPDCCWSAAYTSAPTSATALMPRSAAGPSGAQASRRFRSLLALTPTLTAGASSTSTARSAASSASHSRSSCHSRVSRRCRSPSMRGPSCGPGEYRRAHVSPS